MAKDPAFLFYPGDWQGGTILLTRHQKGCYLDILIAQFNSGPLSLEAIKTVLGSDFGLAWPTLQKKFKQTSDGLFFNERLEAEKNKRQQYSDSRRKNREKKNISISYETHMSPHMENENRNEIRNRNEIKERGPGETIYRIEDCLRISLADERWARANKTNDVEIRQFNDYLERLGVYEMNPADYKRYFAKLKGKYPDMIKTELTVEQLRQLAREIDKQNAA